MEPYIGNQFQSHPSNSGLLRFRSAPSSLISAYTAGTVSNGGGLDKGFDFNQLPTPVDHSGKPLPRFLESTNNDGGAEDPSSPGFDAVETKPFLVPQGGYSGYGSNQLPPYPKPTPGMNAPFQLECSGSVAVDQPTHQRKRIGCRSSSSGGGGGSNLTRQSSSPAGFFAHQNSPSGYNIMGGGGVSSSVLGHLPRIPESTKETTATSSPDVRDSDRYRNGEDAVAAAEFYGTNGFSFGSWDDHSPSPENLSSEFKAHNQQNDSVLYSGSEASPSQSGGVSSRQMLSHHLSLPRSSTDITGVDKLLNFQNSVPCKIRAKRGCATHPRSIAERVRRTRISDRMKKLQELVPNMDKQINTSDMLDLAVHYIKVLQTQYKMLADRRARCVCLNARQHHHAASDQSL